MKVLVTGGAGFIGSHIVDQLLLRGHEVLVVDDLSSGRNFEGIAKYGRIVFDTAAQGYVMSVTSPELFDVVQDFQPDAICHQAAQPSLRRSLDDPAHDALVNIVGTLNVIQAAKLCGAHVVFASTSAVYADGFGRPHVENGPFQPTTPYGLAKLTAERYIEMLAPSYTILRYGNVYGPRQVQVGENQLIPHCLAHLLGGNPFVIHGDGQQTRDFVYAGDIARANVLAIEGRVQGTFNAGTGKGTSVTEVCAILANLTDRPRAFFTGPAKPGEARHVALDSTRAKEQLGWEAQTPLRDGLAQTVAWWKEQR